MRFESDIELIRYANFFRGICYGFIAIIITLELQQLSFKLTRRVYFTKILMDKNFEQPTW